MQRNCCMMAIQHRKVEIRIEQVQPAREEQER
jgi:hypothetical protein